MTIFPYHIQLYFILLEELPLGLERNITESYMGLHKKENIRKISF